MRTRPLATSVFLRPTRSYEVIITGEKCTPMSTTGSNHASIVPWRRLLAQQLKHLFSPFRSKAHSIVSPSTALDCYLVVFSWLGGPRLLLCHALKLKGLPISSSTKSWLVMAHLAHFFLTRGRNFLSQLVSEVCRILDTKQLHTTAYHPQTDGLVERFNGTLKPNHVVDFLLHYLDDFHL